ncbi:hypothetical protein T4D_4649 [Trichinella pseudospiralis]|uniref:Uncharacterized protein n=1 Tax=Trichinella pseudospiralis TaxID=6337 RepID=A0A0V1F336_TRIPS|nr:hypothetical protein T4D_4649 [Trichinella pseudospiralis]
MPSDSQKYHALSDKTLPVTIGFQSGNSDQKIYQLPFAKRASPKFRKFENFEKKLFFPKWTKWVFPCEASCVLTCAMKSLKAIYSTTTK